MLTLLDVTIFWGSTASIMLIKYRQPLFEMHPLSLNQSFPWLIQSVTANISQNGY